MNDSFTLIDAYRTAQRCGTLPKLYAAAADGAHPDNLTAITTIQLMAADARGEYHAMGARETVNAAVNGRPVPLVATHKPTRIWV
jgi:hypothetical protein